MSRVVRRLQLWRDRYRYEVKRPVLGSAGVAARLVADAGVDVTAPGGFAALLQRHLAVTPQAPVWERRGGVEVAGEVDWHLEPHFGVRWPSRLETSITDKLPGSDVVLLWHKNKMMPLLDLARLYEDTGDAKYSAAWYQLVDSWCLQNPYRVGKNWRSPLEIGTRLVVWSMSLGMLRAAGPAPEAVCERMIESVFRQAEYLASHLSSREVPNNHLIGEVATLYTVAAYWPLLRSSAEWMATAEEVLEREVRRQVLADGFDYENSVNYHLYVLDLLLVYLHARALGSDPPPPAILDAATRMLDAALVLVSPAGRFPQIGDDSMTEFLALRRCTPALETAPLGERVSASDLVRPGMAAALAVRDWGRELMERSAALDSAHHFEDAGITVVRGGRSHLSFVSGPQHDREFSRGHLNLDTGGVELEVDGIATFVDSGTYLYTYDAAVRRHFRGASAHNTVVVDGLDPVLNTRVFGFDDIHRARVLAARLHDDGALTGCERPLPGAGGARFVHRRWVVEACDVWLVFDDVAPAGDDADRRHEATVWWHTPLPPTGVGVSDARKFSLAAGAGADVLIVDVFSSGGHDLEVVSDPDDMHTWYSRWYGDLQHGTAIRTRMPVGDGCRVAHVARRPGTSVRFDGWHEGGPLVTVMGDAGTRTLGLSPDAAAITIDGRVVG